MKIGLITSSCLRHGQFIRDITEAFPVSAIVIEEKTYGSSALEEKEKKYFGELQSLDLFCDTIRCKKGEVNSDKIVKFMARNSLDVVLTFGCSILKGEILKTSKRFINIHTGLTQFYRGVDSSIWAIKDKSLDRIGVTIHEVNAGIDTGEILVQGKIDFSLSDDLNDVFLKTCTRGFKILVDNLSKITSGEIKGTARGAGRLYQNKDMTPDILKSAALELPKLLQKHLSK